MRELLERKSNSSADETQDETALSRVATVRSPIKSIDSGTPGIEAGTVLKSLSVVAVTVPSASKSTNWPKKSLWASSVLALLISSQYMLGSRFVSTASARYGTVQKAILRAKGLGLWLWCCCCQ